MLYSILIVAFVTAVLMYLKSVRDLKRAQTEYDALDQGMQELGDGFYTEEEILRDQLHATANELHSANMNVEHLKAQRGALISTHRRHAEEDKRLIDYYQDELGQVSNAALHFQQIVTFHNDNCLPLLGVVNEILADPFAVEMEKGTTTLFDGE